MILTPYQDELIHKWTNAQKVLEAAKEAESILRDKVAMEVFNFDENALKTGTENLELGKGFKLKAEFKLNYSLNNKDDAVDKMLTKLEKSGEDGKFIAERVVRFKPELSVTEYKNLSPKHKAIVDTVLSVKSSKPAISLVPPKAVK
jgi:hypothetical protein